MSESSGIQPDLKVFSTGAIRTKDADGERYDLFSPIGMERLARIYAEGAAKYGDASWERGLPISDLMNHGLRHWRLYASGDRSEDHLAKVAWAAFASMHSEAMWPELNSNLRRQVGDQLNVPPTVDDATAASWAKARDALAAMREENLAENLDRIMKDARRATHPDMTIRHGDRVVREGDGTLRVMEDPWEGQGAYMDGTGTIRYVGPARVATRYHILPVYGYRDRAAMYKADLEFEGHEVVSRWIGGEIEDDPVNDFDLQSCDVAIVLMDVRGGHLRIEQARRFGKPVVLIGPCPDDFPRLGTSDRHFKNWDAFIHSVSLGRHAPKTIVPSR